LRLPHARYLCNHPAIRAAAVPLADDHEPANLKE
jgi:hypothetical protein